MFCLGEVISLLALFFFSLPAYCILFSVSEEHGSDMTCHLLRCFLFFFPHLETSKWIKSAAVLKDARGPGFTSVVPNGLVFSTAHVHVLAHTHACLCVYAYFASFYFPSTVSTQSRRLWDYQSPFVFRREPSWLGGGLHWEPSGLYWSSFHSASSVLSTLWPKPFTLKGRGT